MPWTVATSTIAIKHDDVFVSADGLVKMAATPTRKFWRIWIKTDSGTWVLLPATFRKRDEAQRAAEKVLTFRLF